MAPERPERMAENAISGVTRPAKLPQVNKFLQQHGIANVRLERGHGYFTFWGVQMDVFEAAALGDTGRVRELVKKSPDLLRQHSTDGWTALHLAAFMGHRQTAEALLDLGADLAAISKNQMANQALHAALAGKMD